MSSKNRRKIVSAENNILHFLRMPPKIECLKRWERHLCTTTMRVQKRAFRIILPGLHYADALKNLNCKTLKERRDELCLKTLNKIAIGGPLSRHIPSTRADAHGYNLRNPNILTLYK